MAQNPYAGKPKQDAFLRAAEEAGFPAGSVVGYAEIDSIIGDGTRPWWLINAPEHRAGRGKFALPKIGEPVMQNVAVQTKRAAKSMPKLPKVPSRAVAQTPATDAAAPVIGKVSAAEVSAVPAKAPNFVPFGHFSDLKVILESGFFYPAFITGMSGNGKTFAVMQAAARAKREVFRVNITSQTDEDDLLGGFRLVRDRDGGDAETKWFDGPVVEAMRRGAILLLDEIDLASNLIMCLQPVLEGNPVLLKKINEIVEPQPGFTIVATANTKGKGSDDGRYVGTNVLNDAFLERFAVTLEWDYPSVAIERKIISGSLSKLGVPNPDLAEKLVKWADITRKAFAEDASDELISTRRLEHIVSAFAMFSGKEKTEARAIEKAIGFATNRFDDDTRDSFLDLWEKACAEPEPEEKTSDDLEKDDAAPKSSAPPF